MMTEYQIQAPTRRCTASGRELQVGERYFTALIEEDGHFQRQDFAAEAWKGPPAGAFSYWVGKVPVTPDHHKPRFDDNLLEDCFERLSEPMEPGRVNFRYVLALLLIRRKRLKFEQSRVVGGEERLVLSCPRSGRRWEVVNPKLSDDEMRAVQDEVFEVLGWS
jgi:hypothetical protein